MADVIERVGASNSKEKKAVGEEEVRKKTKDSGTHEKADISKRISKVSLTTKGRSNERKNSKRSE
eukprot:CAMPEP_0201513778 /NCGR_PEP_ID=MMETSP0161_2-20130828/5761_1 /ASSEMBLY_ACC=CAM_ASM_000251 /TAXON_ID=180227 /ORGANISM="Neoparamoeba aestuarina, Strain SoJaBio B1-5/56/2" /LENGTH=64 /DNA_ID=CAMNT_0047910115 /DNA_START=531 /DNA_END=725 /DNA_ORIENTATION=-